MRRTCGTGSITPRGEGRYLLRFVAAGRRQAHTITAASPDDARRKLDAMIVVLEETPEAALGSYTLRTWLIEWQRRHARSRSRKSIAQRVRCHVDTAPFADDLLTNLRERDVRDHIRRLLSRGLAPSTVRSILTLLRTALEEAREDELVAVNAARGARLPRDTPERDEVRAPLTHDDLLALFAADLRVVDKAMIAVAGVGGLRSGELHALPFANVRDEPAAVMIRVEFGGFAGAPTKNSKSRTVPVIGEGARWLRQWLAEVARDRQRNPEALLFVGDQGGRRDLTHASTWLRVRLRAAGLKEGHRFHDLRHTAAAGWLNGWWMAPLATAQVQAIMGHASVAQTEHYTGTATDAMLAAVRAAEDQRRIKVPGGVIESAALTAKSEPTGRRRPCRTETPVISTGWDTSDPSLILPVGDRAATERLVGDIASGRVTLEDIDTWREAVLAQAPEPWRSLFALPEGPFRVRAALAIARQLLAMAAPELGEQKLP